MLERARVTTHAPGIKYLRCAIEDIDFPANEFDIVISSLALRYVESFDRVCCKINHYLTPKAYSSSRSNTRSSPPCARLWK
jgi:ubiquinone/menaquinone biosynthesis C-methylase UbiE